MYGVPVVKGGSPPEMWEKGLVLSRPDGRKSASCWPCLTSQLGTQQQSVLRKDHVVHKSDPSSRMIIL